MARNAAPGNSGDAPPDAVLIPAAFAAMGTEGRILRATMECIIRRGIAATTTHVIARVAGVNQGVIHYHFRSKDELLMRLLHLLFAEGAAMMDRISASDQPARRKVGRVLELGHRFTTERSDVFVIYIAFWAHALAQGGKWQKSYQELRARLVAAIRDIILAGERSGDFRKGVATPAAELLLACVQGLGLQAVMGPDTVRPERVSAYFGTFLQFLLGTAQPEAKPERERRDLRGISNTGAAFHAAQKSHRRRAQIPNHASKERVSR